MFKRIFVYILLALFCITFWSLAITVVFGAEIDMDTIAHIESSYNPKAYNKHSGARGMYQITSICLEDYLQYHKDESISLDELFVEEVNERVARWYIEKRIPKLLRHYNKEVNVINILISYNAGISYVGKQPPRETVNYINKYIELTF
jgi:soluble lytic murein transglycosylase-like protein